MSTDNSKAKTCFAISMHSSQGKIFRRTQDELIEDDWMKFKALNMRKEDSFQADQEVREAKRSQHEQTKNGFTLILKPSQDISQTPQQVVSFSKYYEDLTSQKNILSNEDMASPIQESNLFRYDDKLSSHQLQLQQINTSNQQLQQPTISAGLRKRINSRSGGGLNNNHNNHTNNGQNNYKPSLNMIGSTSVVENGKDHRHSNSSNMRLLNQKNFNRIMNIRKRIWNFINYYTAFGRKAFLKNEDLRQEINDKSDCGESNDGDTNIILLRLYRFLGWIRGFKCFRIIKSLKFHVINPHTTEYLIWQMYVTLYNYLFFIALSLIIVFSAGVNNEHIENIYFAITSFQWGVEIFLKFNTAQYVKTRYISSRSEIIKVYFKKQFIFDIIPLVLILLRSQYHSRVAYIGFRIPLFLKLVSSIKETREAEKQLLMKLKHFYLVQLLNLVVNLFLVGHFIACLWYLMYLIQRDILNSDESWFSEGIGADGVWWKIYLQAFYWSFTLMATGSNEATNTLEVFFTSVIMLFTTIVFGYMVNTIGVILSEMNKLEEDQRKDINLINKYMKRKQISKKLQQRINLDLEQFYLRSTRNKSEEENSALAKISNDLNEEIKLEYNKNILSKIKFISDNFTEETIDKLCLSIEEAFYSPNQIIIQEKEQNDPSLMIIVSGQVDILKRDSNQLNITNLINEDNNENHNYILAIKKNSTKDSQNVVKTLKKGSTIGEIDFFTGYQSRENAAKSRTFTTILKIERNTFLQIIENNQRDFEKFCEMKDKLLLYQDYRTVNKRCLFCQSYQHTEISCNQAHFNKKSPFLFRRINLYVPQQRSQEHQRRINKQDNSYVIRNTAVTCIETLREQYDLIELNKNQIQNSEKYLENNLVSIDYDIDDDEQHKYNYDDDDNDYSNDGGGGGGQIGGKYSPGVSPRFNKEDSIIIGSVQGAAFQSISTPSPNTNGLQQLFMIPEETIITQKTLEQQQTQQQQQIQSMQQSQQNQQQQNEAPIFQNASSMVYLGYNSSSNVENGFQPQRKQTIRFIQNGYNNNNGNIINNNSVSNQSSNINQSVTREDLFNKEPLEKDYNEDTVRSVGKDYLYQSIRDNEAKKSIIMSNSPRANVRQRTMLTKKQTSTFNENNIIQSRKFLSNGLTIQPTQFINTGGLINTVEKQIKQNERSGERLNSFIKTENWNERKIPLEEKDKNDFLFEFDSLKQFQNYFIEGNANIKIAKWTTQRKKYLKKYASGGDATAGKRNNRTLPTSARVKSSRHIKISQNDLNPSVNEKISPSQQIMNLQ